MKCFFGLHFVDAVEVEDIFVDLMSVAPDDEKCIKFADYLVENHVTNDLKFPFSIWAEIPSDKKMSQYKKKRKWCAKKRKRKTPVKRYTKLLSN